jgi:phytoene dehydrogenase-like protein
MRILGGRAVVLGAGLAGLFTARVLSEAYDQVTLIERDLLPPPGEARRGSRRAGMPTP